MITVELEKIIEEMDASEDTMYVANYYPLVMGGIGKELVRQRENKEMMKRVSDNIKQIYKK